MVPRFSLSARFVRDAVQHARSLHAFTSAHAWIHWCKHAFDRENAFRGISTDYRRNAISVLQARELAPSVEGQVSIILVVSMVLE